MLQRLPCLLGAFTLVTHSFLHAAGDIDRTPDVSRLTDFILIDRSYTRDARRQALRDASKLADTANDLSPAQFYLEVARIAALADNGHSNLSAGPVAREFGLLPVRAYWFSDGLHIVRAQHEHVDLLGARIIAIGGVNIDEAAERMKIYHGGSMEHFRAYFAPLYLLSPALLNAGGITEDSDRANLTVADEDGAERTVQLARDPRAGDIDRVRPWRWLHPAPLDGEGDSWRSVQDDELPLHLQEPDTVFRYQLLDDDVAYLQLRNNFASSEQSVRDYLEGLRETIASDGPTHLIVDVRHSPGGDLTRTAGFMLDVPSMIPAEGRVAALTSNATFSAAIYTAFFPKSIDAERTHIIGERVGDRTRFWAETWSPLILPVTGYRINYSLEVHDIGTGCNDYETCHMAQYDAMSNIAIGSVDPDVVVPTRYADYAADRDPVLDRAHEVLGR